MLAYSPLEQFAILQIVPLSLGGVYMSFTNSALVMIVAVGLFCALLSMVTTNGGSLVPGHWQSLTEMVYEFVTNLVEELIGEKGQTYFPLIFTTFTFLLLCNLIGMIPYSFTATSHFIVTLGLALSLSVGIVTIGFLTHGIHFLSLLMPKGAPLALAPFLVPLELLSYTSKFASLGIRLGANMLAGHCLLKIIAGFGWTMLNAGGIMPFVAFGPIGMVFILTGLELGIAVIQAYVFSMLICIYLNESIYLH
jgi:F-type H+-transporting ATPase subunit a